MKLVLFCLLLIVSTAFAADTVDQIIAEKGLFVFSDGSSFYAFKQGGSFESGPTGMCGRTIEGTWTKDRNGRYVVNGKWGWMNGISATNDFRIMSIYLSNAHDPSPEEGLSSMTITKPVHIYKVYAIIESLEKAKEPRQSIPAQQPAESLK